MNKIFNKEIIACYGHSNTILTFDFSSDNKYIVTSGCDKSVIITELSTLEKTMQLYNICNCTIECVVFSPDNQHLAFGGFDGVVNLTSVCFNDKNLIKIWELLAHDKFVREIKFLDNNRFITIGGSNPQLKIWNISNRTCTDVIDLNFHPYGIRLLNNSLYAVFGQSNKIYIFENNKKITELCTDHPSEIYDLAFSGNWLTSCGNDAIIQQQYMQEEKEIHIINDAPFLVRTLHYSPDQEYLVVASTNGEICFYDAYNCNCKVKFSETSQSPNKDFIYKIRYSPDGKILIYSTINAGFFIINLSGFPNY